MLDCDVQKYVSSFVNVSYCPFPSGAMIAAGSLCGLNFLMSSDHLPKQWIKGIATGN